MTNQIDSLLQVAGEFLAGVNNTVPGAYSIEDRRDFALFAIANALTAMAWMMHQRVNDDEASSQATG